MLTDEEVVSRVQAGQAELFEIIFDRHYARIDRYVRGFGIPELSPLSIGVSGLVREFEAPVFRPEPASEEVKARGGVAVDSTRAIRSSNWRSNRKFWPSDFVSRMPSAVSNCRISETFIRLEAIP